MDSCNCGHHLINKLTMIKGKRTISDYCPRCRVEFNQQQLNGTNFESVVVDELSGISEKTWKEITKCDVSAAHKPDIRECQRLTRGIQTAIIQSLFAQIVENNTTR